MNFMSGRAAGSYEEPTTGGMSSSSSSSSSSLQHKGLPLYTYHHQHPEQPYGGGAAQLPDSSPINNDEAVDDNSDDHMMFIRRGGGEGSSAGTGTAAHNNHHVLVIEREHMFDKVVTPSDVGKLNRLVIPKQHAEKYFPLDSSTNEKGLLLNFEDRNGKPWRFRYSYWNSSQSYVMTKGWSRFVKEKKLDAGDIVSFQRGIGESGKDRLFIDWRRRPDAPDLPPSIPTLSIPHQFSFQRSSIHPWNPLFLQPPQSRSDYSHYLLQNHQSSYHHQNIHSSSSTSAGYGAGPYAYNNSSIVNGNPCPPGSILYLQRSGAPGGGRGVYGPQQVGIMQAPQRGSSGVHHDQQQQQQMVYESVPVVQGKAAAKRLRLFGVNMDCPISESDHHNHHHHHHEYNCDILLSSSSTTTIPPHSSSSSSSSTIPLIHHMNNNGLVMPPPPPNYFHSSPSSSIPYLQLGPNNNYNDHSDDDKGKGGGSMSLDLDI